MTGRDVGDRASRRTKHCLDTGPDTLGTDQDADGVRLQAATYNMSASPPTKELNVDPGAQSPDDESMSRDPDAQQQGLGYEFEVKEQDRWLPIANGGSIHLSSLTLSLLDLRVCLFHHVPCRSCRSCTSPSDWSHRAPLRDLFSLNYWFLAAPPPGQAEEDCER